MHRPISNTSPAGLDQIAVLIPAWRPGAPLSALVAQLQAAGLTRILVIDDGSGADGAEIFSALEREGVQSLRHAVNLGKGRALKTGFNHVLTRCPLVRAVVTADADGQHTSADILRVAQAWLANNGRPVLGARSFSRDVPLRSRFGNELTRLIFRLVSGTALADTQTGLRAIPTSLLPQLMTLDGERYEYEMTVLAHLCGQGMRPIELPIETVYVDGNRSSHFNPVRDSMRIYFVLARFSMSALLAAGIDLAAFSIAFALTHRLLLSFAVGRISSLVNFLVNRGYVFHNRGSLTDALWRYYLLAIAIATVSYSAIWALVSHAGWNVFAAKLCADTLLFLISFSVQRTFVFRRTAERNRA